MPIPSYIPCMVPDDGETESSLIVKYHAQGCSNNEILSFLKSHHGLTMSLSSLKRRLSKLGLKRIFQCDENKDEIRNAILKELEEVLVY